MALTTLEIKHALPGLHADGGGLYLSVPSAGRGSWIFRFQLNGRRREMGLGSLDTLTVAKARAAAEELRGELRKGVDPLAARQAEALTRQEAAAAVLKERELARMSFRSVAEAYISAHSVAWRNAKHSQQWPNSLKAYVYPLIGDLPVRDVTTKEVLEILTPLWTSKPETARRVRSRIELVLAYAKARGWYVGENAATWRGHLSALLPPVSKVRAVKHHAALDWRQMADFMTELRSRPGTSARALEFLILTAARSGEVRGAEWREIDFEGKLWTIPASRMKAGKEHRVPLSRGAIELLNELPRLDDERLVFPSARSRRALSDMSLGAALRRTGRNGVTVHGFRSAFRDWAAEATMHHPDVVELALAHVVRNKVEAAYRRGDLLTKRRELMADWEAWCAGSLDPDLHVG